MKKANNWIKNRHVDLFCFHLIIFAKCSILLIEYIKHRTIQKGTQMDTPIKKPFLYKDLSYIIQGCFFQIRKEYGPGHKESVYQNIIIECLQDKPIKVEKEKSINIYSNQTGKKVGSYRPDLIIDNKIIIEIKSSRFTTKQDEKQLYHYLRNSKYEIGYLVNFSTAKLYVKRIIYTNDRKPFLKGV